MIFKKAEVTKMCDKKRNDELRNLSEDKSCDENFKAMFKGKLAENGGIQITVDGTPDALLALITAMVHFYAKKFDFDVASLLLVINEGIKKVFDSKAEYNEVQHPGDGV